MVVDAFQEGGLTNTNSLLCHLAIQRMLSLHSTFLGHSRFADISIGNVLVLGFSLNPTVSVLRLEDLAKVWKTSSQAFRFLIGDQTKVEMLFSKVTSLI